jgi:chromosome segregation ATPase
MMTMDQIADNAPLEAEAVPLPESELPEILEPDLDQVSAPKMTIAELGNHVLLVQSLQAELAYAQGLNAGMKENVEKLKAQNKELQEQLAWKENLNKALNDRLRHLEEQNCDLTAALKHQDDHVRGLSRRNVELSGIEADYNREQAHKATHWALLLAVGGVLGWAAALILARVLGWF